MRKYQQITFTIVFFYFCGLIQAQTAKPASSAPKSAAETQHLQVYRNAYNSGDYTTAIVSLNYVVVINASTGKYRDSLAYLYYSANNFYQSLYWSNEVLKANPNYIGMLELKGNCLQQTSQVFPAIEIYETLMKISPTPIYAFHLTELQYQAKRLYECYQTTKQAEGLEFPKGIAYSYKVSESKNLTTPLQAAFFNYQGLALYELGEKLQALQSFEKALALDSTFVLAISNLETVKKELSAPSGNENPVKGNDKVPAEAVMPLKK